MAPRPCASPNMLSIHTAWVEKRGLWIKAREERKYTSFLGTDLKTSLSAEWMEQAHHPPPGLLSDTKQPSGLDPSHVPRDVLGMTSH